MTERRLTTAIVVLAVLAAGVMIIDILLVAAYDRLNRSIIYVEAPK